MTKKIVWIVIILISIFAFLPISKMFGRKKEQKPSNAAIISPSYGSIYTSISTTGTIKPQNRLEIKPPICGRVEEILVEEGDKVKVGQVLALMSSTERAALLDSARLQDSETVKYWESVYNATPLLSPIEGDVIVRAVEPGQTVVATDSIIVLSDRLIVQAEVDETDIGKVKKGQSAIISLDAYSDIKIRGKIDHIAYESTLVNNVIIYEVDILPETTPGVFRSGMSANVEIIEKSKDKILLIPHQAVRKDEKGKFVLLRIGRNRKPVREYVQLGISDNENVEVISGVTAEDNIVVIEKEYALPNNQAGKNPFMPFSKRKRNK